MSTIKMMGIPKDGSKPFLMAIVDSVESGKRIFKETAHLYVQPLDRPCFEDFKPASRKTRRTRK